MSYHDAVLCFDSRPLSYHNAILSYDNPALSYRNAARRFDIRPLSYRNAILSYDIPALPYRNAALHFHIHPLSYDNHVLSYDNPTLSYRNAAPSYPKTPLHFHIRPLSYDNDVLWYHNPALSDHKTAPQPHQHVAFHPGTPPPSHPHPTQEAPLMPNWNSGVLWTSGALWGPASPHPPLKQHTQTKRHQRTMKRQPYYPRLLDAQPEWHFNYADRLAELGAGIGLLPADITASVNDSRHLGYALGVWLTKVREFGPGVTGELETLRYGTGTTAFELPDFVAPTPPAGLTPVLPGALNRIFKYVQTIKSAPGYTEGIGILMRIVGQEDTIEHLSPELTLKVEQGPTCQCVRIRFKKWEHYAIALYSKRGTTDWELLGIDTDSPYIDERPLLNPTQPELRSYRARFWDAGTETGDWTDITTTTVAP